MSALNGINKTLDMPMDLESISLTEQVYRSVLIIVSLAINTGVLVVICCSRQLHYPRHIYWAAISIVNSLSAFQWINEILGIVLQIEFARRGFVLNVGIVYTMLLHCLFLATIDRYVAIAHYKWYKKKVTNKIVVTLLVTTTGATYLAGTSPFWTGVKRISSGTVNLTHMNCLLIWDLILGIMCVVINFRILTLSRFFIKQYMDQHTFQQTPISILFSKSPNSNAGINCKKNCTKLEDHGSFTGILR